MAEEKKQKAADDDAGELTELEISFPGDEQEAAEAETGAEAGTGEPAAARGAETETAGGDETPAADVEPTIEVPEEQGPSSRAEAGRPDADRKADLKPSYVKQLEEKLAEKERRLEEVYRAHRSNQEETARVRERLERDREKRVFQAKTALFARLLEPIDNLERCAAAARGTGDAASIADGVDMVHKHILDVLTSLGLAREDPTGQQFDPARHDAVSVARVEAAEQHDTIISVVQPGYSLDGQVVRAARVVVGKHQAE